MEAKENSESCRLTTCPEKLGAGEKSTILIAGERNVDAVLFYGTKSHSMEKLFASCAWPDLKSV